MLLGYTIRFHNITDAAAKMSCVVIASHFSKFPPPPLFLVIFYHRPAPLSHYSSLPLLLFLLNLPLLPIPTVFFSPSPSSPVHLSCLLPFLNFLQYHFSVSSISLSPSCSTNHSPALLGFFLLLTSALSTSPILSSLYSFSYPHLIYFLAALHGYLRREVGVKFACNPCS